MSVIGVYVPNPIEPQIFVLHFAEIMKKKQKKTLKQKKN